MKVKDKFFLISGIANAKSIAYSVANILKDNGAKVILSVQNSIIKEKVKKLFPDEKIFICDVASEDEIKSLGQNIKTEGITLAGYLHSVAWAPLVPGQAFHETSYADLEIAARVSSFSLIRMSAAIKDSLAADASVVTVSISSTRVTSYGILGPIKAMLESTVAFLAKSFSEFSQIRFNAVSAGPLKTSASAGIPGYLDNYLYAEQLILRKKALETSEVADTICFLLAPSSSGINAESIIVDGGMSCNYFDQEVVKTVVKKLY